MKSFDKAQIPVFRQQIQAGGVPERRAINELYETFHYFIQQGGQRFRLPLAEVESAYHQAVYGLVESLRDGSFRGESSLKTYLYRAFKNQCINFSKKPRQLEKGVSLEACESMNCEQPTPDQHLIARESLELVHHCMSFINERADTILWGSAVHGWSSQEIAQKTGLKNAATVDVLKRRYRQKLRNMLPGQRAVA